MVISDSVLALTNELDFRPLKKYQRGREVFLFSVPDFNLIVELSRLLFLHVCGKCSLYVLTCDIILFLSKSEALLIRLY